MPLKDHFTFSREFQYKPLNPSTKEIRLMEIESGKDPDKEVRCKMFHRRLEDAGEYIALSYTWGDPSQRCSIWVNGRRIKVTRSLEQALRQLHKFSGPDRLLFWVDAVCINQADLNERSRQVRVMRDIYVAAKMVFAWIGRKTAYCHQAFDLIEDMANRWVKDEYRVTNEGEEWIKGQTSFLLDSRWIALGDLLQRPWWTRAWIVQEVVVSNNAVIVCGDFALPWNYFVYATSMFNAYLGCVMDEALKGIDNSTHPEECDLGCKRLARIGEGLARVATITVSILERQQNSPAKSFYDAIRGHRDTQATDPLDKIYAFLGLADVTHTEVESLPIDYTLSPPELFRTYIQLHLRAHQNLEFLGDCCGLSGPADFSSWMPHLDPKGSRFKTPFKILEYSPKIIYRAATQKEATFEIGESGRVLVIEGIYLDDVDVTGAVYDLRPGEKLGHVEYNTTNVERSWRALIGLEMIDNIEMTPDYEQKFRNMSLYPTRKRIWKGDAYMRTIYFNPNADLVTDFFDPKLSMLQTNNMKAHDLEQDPTDTFLRTRLGQTCPNRRFFVTKKGYYGMGPEETCAGDQVCVLFGTIAPFVFRPMGHQLALIGESYLHGFMNGEAIVEMDEGRLKSTKFAFR